MKKEINNVDAFQKELETILNKYNLKNVVIGAEYGDKFIGIFGAERRSRHFKEAVDCFANTARLYQSARENLMNCFDEIATKRK